MKKKTNRKKMVIIKNGLSCGRLDKTWHRALPLRPTQSVPTAQLPSNAGLLAYSKNLQHRKKKKPIIGICMNSARCTLTHRQIQSNCCKRTSVRDCIASGCQWLPLVASVPYLHSSRLDVRTKFYTGLQAHFIEYIMRSVINLIEAVEMEA